VGLLRAACLISLIRDPGSAFALDLRLSSTKDKSCESSNGSSRGDGEIARGKNESHRKLR